MSKVSKYRPSNCTEGEIFKDRFCRRCEWYMPMESMGCMYNGCPIELAVLKYEKSDNCYPPQWRLDENGEPVCTEFREEA